MGPAPAVAAVRSAVRAVLDSHPVLVACSGGADSLALAAAVAFEAPRAGVRAGLVTIDHGLQPGSALVAARVAAVGYELGFDPVEIVPVSVGTAGGVEAAARAARYAALDAVAVALGAVVLLGHTLDDQAETVLLGLGRGSGPRSVAGMRVVDGRYRRPLLGVRRSTTVAACSALGLEPWEDPHNADPAFQRARLRGEVLPLLEDVLQGGVAEALARTAELLQDDLDALDAWAAAVRPSVQVGSPPVPAAPPVPATRPPVPAPPTPAPAQVINSPVATPEGGSERVDHREMVASVPTQVINSGKGARSGTSSRLDHRVGEGEAPDAASPAPTAPAPPTSVINSPVATPEGGSERVDHLRTDGRETDGRETDGRETGGRETDGLEPDGLDVAALAELPRAVRTRVLRAWAQDGGADPLTAERTAALDGLVTRWRGQGPIELSGGVSVRRLSGRLEVTRAPTPGDP